MTTARTLRFGVDTGGTFTDLVIEGLPGGLLFFKRPTTPDDPVRGLLDTVAAAAGELGLTPRELLEDGKTFIHGTTRATNAIVEGATARTAFLTSKGHRDILLIREGGGRVAPMDYSQPYPDPYVPRSLTFEIPGRVRASGAVRDALDEAAVVETIARLRDADVEAVAVCLLWSIVNPAHERRVGELLDEHLPGVPYTLSHRLNPTVREYRRASSTAIDASLKPLMSRYIGSLAERLRDAGFSGRLLLLTSSGGVLDAADVWDAPIHSIGSGPAAAPVAGRHYGKLDAGSDTAIVTDAGGTTYDVSLIRRGAIPWTRETIVGDGPYGNITGFPSVDVRSVGAGGGSIGWVDEGGLLHVGPQSAGADPGPACYGRGGDRPTVTDACLVLDYIDPDYFLGGDMRLDRDAAAAAIRRGVAKPLGLDLDEAAAAVVNLACDRMVTAIEEITLNQGIDPRAAVMVGGGGGAGLYSVTIARRLGTEQIVIPDVAATLSAAGALRSDLQRDFGRTALMTTEDFDLEAANRILEGLERSCREFAEGPGRDSIEQVIRFSAEARYPDQVWEVEVPFEVERLARDEDVERFRARFHEVHEELFGANDPGSHVEIVSWRAHVSCRLQHSQTARAGTSAPAERGGRRRAAYFPGTGRVEAAVRRLEELADGDVLRGPAIVESPVTTVVVPPGASVGRLPSGSLLIHPWSTDAAGASDSASTERSVT